MEQTIPDRYYAQQKGDIMITTLLITAAVILTTAGCVLFYCITHAPDGHENAEGFHFGNELTRRKPYKARKARPAMAGGKFHLPAA